MVKLTEYAADVKNGTDEKHILSRCVARDGKVFEYDSFGTLKKTWSWEQFRMFYPDGMKYDSTGRIFADYAPHRKWKCTHTDLLRYSEEDINGKESNVCYHCAFCGHVKK